MKLKQKKRDNDSCEDSTQGRSIIPFHFNWSNAGGRNNPFISSSRRTVQQQKKPKYKSLILDSAPSSTNRNRSVSMFERPMAARVETLKLGLQEVKINGKLSFRLSYTLTIV